VNQGLYAAASGMLAVEGRQEVIANNLANVSTPGFKRHEPAQLGFYQVLADRMRRPFVFNQEAAPAGGVKFVEAMPDTSNGALRDTGNALDMALEGPGFFVVSTPGGDRFTRAGSFSVDIDGHLATKDGFKLQSVGGQPLDVRGSNVVVDQDGQIAVDGVGSGRLRLLEFEEPRRLLRVGNSLYRATEPVLERSAAAADTRVHQHQIELSNVAAMRELSQMMLGLRAYEANHRVITAIDDTMSRLIQQVAIPS